MIQHTNLSRAAQTIFFFEQTVKVAEAFKLHIAWGVWEAISLPGSDKDLNRGDWNNVTEHCLIVMSRGDALAEILQLPTDLHQQLIDALILHDISKPEEVAYARKLHGHMTWHDYEDALKDVDERLKKAGFDDMTVYLSGAMGHPSLLATQEILKKDDLSAVDLAYLIAHYADDVALKAEWCAPAYTVGGKKMNQLDLRMDRNRNNDNIRQLGEEGKSRFGGKNTFDAQNEIGHMVEARLVAELNEKGVTIKDPLDLPEFIDTTLKTKIAAIQAY